MPGYAKSGGSWKYITSLQVKKPSGWSRATTGWINNGSQWVRFFTSGIQDTFNRANGSLGTTSDGSAAWSVTRGAWTINSNTATSSTAAGSYPLAVVSLGQAQALVQADTPVAGSGIAFGVVDANNWFGAFITRRSSTYSCNPYACNPYCCGTTNVTDCNACGSTCVAQPCVNTSYTSNAAKCGTTCTNYKKLESHNFYQYKCTSSGWVYTGTTGFSSCSECNCTNGTIAFACNTLTLNSVTSTKNCLGTSGCPETVSCGCINSTANSCTVCEPQPCVNTCNTCSVCSSTCYATCYSTCTGYRYGVQLVRCVAGTVSSLGLTEGTLDGFQPLSIKVLSTSAGITATAYSGTGASGSSTIVVTSNLVPSGTQQGIMIGPSTVSQGSTVDNFYTEVQ